MNRADIETARAAADFSARVRSQNSLDELIAHTRAMLNEPKTTKRDRVAVERLLARLQATKGGAL